MVIKLIALILATLCIGLYTYGVSKSKNYEYLSEGLDNKEYPLNEIYSIGYAISAIEMFRLRGKLREKLVKNAKLLHQNVYVEYYVELAWAQFLSCSLFFSCIFLLFAGLMPREMVSICFILIILIIAVFWNMFLSKMGEQIQKRREACMIEFPDMVLKLSLLIGSGMVLREAWKLIAYGKDGELYQLMRVCCDDMENGASDADAVYQFGVLTDADVIKKFTGIIVQELEKGSGELENILSSQSSELWAHKRQMLLQKGEKAAGKLIIPVGITFGGIILVIMVAAMSGLSF